ncbi:phage major capsid protein [Bradyrhizobium sp. 87]|uniref:phage major capsid protein n=1 Tax=Bradyrhizobium sp. 87 TaxID=2782682 RepID=UPI001FF9CB9D|nr:phage major capsid protein [Bradyrhizobium sp. 87]MCK1431069.1 phage major capsid protein [Bradyrhizobium sp. 87]
MAGVSILPRGTHFTRMALAIAKSGTGAGPEAAAIANDLWGPASIPALALKSAVTPGGLSNPNFAALAEYRTAASDFIAMVYPMTVLGKLSGTRKLPFLTRAPRQTAGATIGWIGESRPAPVSGLTFDTVTFAQFKVSGICVTTKELARLSTPEAEGVIRSDLASATIKMLDTALLDPAAAETDISPASIANAALSFAASGTTGAALRDDLRRLFNAVFDAGVEMTAPYLITSRQQCIALALMDQEFTRDVTVNGGMLAGVPIISSSSSSSSTDTNSPPVTTSDIVLVDAAELLVAADDTMMIDSSEQATLQMDSLPDSPPTASTAMVNLWQHNLAAWKIIKPANWKMRRAGAVARITNCNYAG